MPNVAKTAPLDSLMMTSPFGYRKPFKTENGALSSDWHKGMDLAAKLNDNVYSMFDGKVTAKAFQTAMGNYVSVETSLPNFVDIKLTYQHLNKFADGLNIGSKVTAGQVIGYTGKTGNSTGVHLHIYTYEKINGSWVAVDPMKYL